MLLALTGRNPGPSFQKLHHVVLVLDMCVLVENSARKLQVFITPRYEVKHHSCSIVDNLKTCSKVLKID